MGSAIRAVFGGIFGRAEPGEFEIYQIELTLGSTITGALAVVIPVKLELESTLSGGAKLILRRRPN